MLCHLCPVDAYVGQHAQCMELIELTHLCSLSFTYFTCYSKKICEEKAGGSCFLYKAVEMSLNKKEENVFFPTISEHIRIKKIWLLGA